MLPQSTPLCPCGCSLPLSPGAKFRIGHHWKALWVERFWAQAPRSDGCWDWTGAVASEGYGKTTRDRKSVNTHRVAWELTHGEIPVGLWVFHHCGNRLCVRPDHLYLGNPADAIKRPPQRKPVPLKRYARSCEQCGSDFLAKNSTRRFCDRDCWKASSGTPTERFWANTRKGPGCWEWTGNRQSFGYGKLRVDGYSVGAHRFSWELHNGPITGGMHVLHRCDTPPCVRPDHLFLGTAADNIADKVQKGRQPRGFSQPEHCIRRGEANRLSLLTTDQVLKIRSLHAFGVRPTEIARRFGILYSTVWRIVTRRAWAHV